MTDQSTKFEAIKARHDACIFTVTKSEWNEREAYNAHDDRATLITLVEAERARADKAEAELAKVREAAGPFVQTLKHDISDDETATDYFRPIERYNHAPRLTVGHFRALARAVGEEG